MSNQRYTPEFKEEAVRQVTKRGYPVPEQLNTRPRKILKFDTPKQVLERGVALKS